VQAAGYQLILNRLLVSNVLPRMLLLLPGNRDSDKGVTYRNAHSLAESFH
jgi:hypothetical protein